jgi:hypothetical protein
MWNKIVNPLTGKKIGINSKIGLNILSKYLKQYRQNHIGGAAAGAAENNDTDSILINFRVRAYGNVVNERNGMMSFYNNYYYKNIVFIGQPMKTYNLNNKISLKQCYDLCMYLRNTPIEKLAIDIDYGDIYTTIPYVWKSKPKKPNEEEKKYLTSNNSDIIINEQLEEGMLKNNYYYIANIYVSNSKEQCDIQPYIGGTIKTSNILNDLLRELREELSNKFSFEYLLTHFDFDSIIIGSKKNVEFTFVGHTPNINIRKKKNDLYRLLIKTRTTRRKNHSIVVNKIHVLINLGEDYEVAKTEFESITNHQWSHEEDVIAGICLIKGDDINRLKRRDDRGKQRSASKPRVKHHYKGKRSRK